MTSFQYDPLISENYPKLVAGVIIASGIANPPSSPALRDIYLAEQTQVKARIGSAPLSELPSLKAWRRAFSAFGVSPTKYRSAAEALLRRLTKKGDIPSINTLVDIGNLISIRYGLPVAIFDTSAIAAPVTVHYSDGSEAYTELSSAEVMQPEPGEVIFSDASNMVVARRWCWRQSATSAANDTTSDAIITIEAHHENAPQDIKNALADLRALLGDYAGGEYQAKVLNADQPSI